jgi:ABC-type branched-subunit amino acid transport system ATPase component
VALDIADYGYVMENGRIVLDPRRALGRSRPLPQQSADYLSAGLEQIFPKRPRNHKGLS